MATYASIAQISVADAKVMVLGWAKEMKLPVLSWHDGSLPMFEVEILARIIWLCSGLAAVIKTLTVGKDATGKALDQWSESVYDHTRNAEESAVYKCKLTCSSSQGPYTITDGSVVVTDGIRIYSNTSTDSLAISYPRTLASGGTLTLPFVCSAPGADGSTPDPSEINRLVTTMAGVTILGTSLLTSGADEETDAALYERDKTKWPTLNQFTLPRDAYVYWARSASSSVVRVTVIDNNPRGEFTVDVIIAGQNSDSGDEDVSAVEAVLATKLLTPFYNAVSIIKATIVDVTPVGTIYLVAGTDVATAKTAITAALSALAATIPIGGYTYESNEHVYLRAQFEKAIESLSCVDSAVLTTPSAYTTIGEYEGIKITATYSSSYLNLVVLSS